MIRVTRDLIVGGLASWRWLTALVLDMDSMIWLERMEAQSIFGHLLTISTYTGQPMTRPIVLYLYSWTSLQICDKVPKVAQHGNVIRTQLITCVRG
jgi:hypothetical protein